MPNPNAVVALVSRIDPPVTRPPAEMMREFPNGFLVELEGQQSARLYVTERSAGMLEILEGLRKLRAPVYLELDPDTRGIVSLLIPDVSRVGKIYEREGNVEFLLELSHARHILTRENSDFDLFVETLRNAQAKNAVVAVTQNDKNEIVDVRPHVGESPHTGAAVPSHPTPPLRRGCLWWFCCFFRCVTPRRAQELFDLCAAQTCNPTTVPPPCIPFMYPDDGCWARAHEMCRLMINAGAHPNKVWIDGWLHTLTKNNPNCFVNWGWHVAPTICVRKGWFRCSDQVIDPSLFTGPVSKATWKGVQGDPNATLTDTAASVYMLPNQTDPAYADTNFQLDKYRLKLKNRSLGPSGPPPYAYC